MFLADRQVVSTYSFQHLATICLSTYKSSSFFHVDEQGDLWQMGLYCQKVKTPKISIYPQISLIQWVPQPFPCRRNRKTWPRCYVGRVSSHSGSSEGRLNLAVNWYKQLHSLINYSMPLFHPIQEGPLHSNSAWIYYQTTGFALFSLISGHFIWGTYLHLLGDDAALMDSRKGVWWWRWWWGVVVKKHRKLFLRRVEP